MRLRCVFFWYLNVMYKIIALKTNVTELKNIIRESVTRILKEDTTNIELMNAWQEATDKMGAEAFLDALYRAMSEDDIRKNLEFISRMYELDLFNNNEEDLEGEYI